MSDFREGDYDQKAVGVIHNLSHLVRRLCYRLKKHEPDSKIANQAIDYLLGEGLQGSILRGPAKEAVTLLPELLDRLQATNIKAAIEQLDEHFRKDKELLDAFIKLKKEAVTAPTPTFEDGCRIGIEMALSRWLVPEQWTETEKQWTLEDALKAGSVTAAQPFSPKDEQAAVLKGMHILRDLIRATIPYFEDNAVNMSLARYAADCRKEVADKLAAQPDLRALTPEDLAKRFHESYERLAPSFGYSTRKESAKPWSEVPEQNRNLMIAVCAEFLGSAIGAEK